MVDDEIRALREELAKLRERVAVLEARAASAGSLLIDWTKPLMVGSPRFVQSEPLPPGTITCGATHG